MSTLPPPLPETLGALLAQPSPSASPCLIDRDQPIDRQTLSTQAQHLARALIDLGVHRGDRVAIWLPNVPAWLAMFFACARIGAIAVAVNTRFRSNELVDILGRSGCKVLVYWPGFDRVDFNHTLNACDANALPALSCCIAYTEGESVPKYVLGKPVHAYPTLLQSAPLFEDQGNADCPCVIFTTSGTTKAPKFVLHTQRSMLTHARDVAQGFGLHAHSLLYLAPPLCGVFGLCSVLAALSAHRPCIMHPVWDATQADTAITRYQVTHFNATDDAIAQLLARSTRTPIYPTVAFVGYAAFNPAQADIVTRAQARGLTVLGLYGISEIQALFSRQREDAPLAQRMLGGGYPVSSRVRVRTRDPETGQVLGHEQSGELEFFAPDSRMLEYFGDDASTAAATTEDGWYRSGDLGYTQADGCFVYLTRMGDSLRLGGFLVSPAEIEAMIQTLPEIDACQVVGVTINGALRPVAFVIPKHNAVIHATTIIDHVAQHLARYKVPVRVLTIDRFPVTEGTNATKIQKHKLRALAQEQLNAV